MKNKLLLFVTLCLSIIAFAVEPPSQNLWDQIVRQEQVVLTVIYKGRSLNVWKQDTKGYTRYYVTPLCNIDVNSIICEKDEYSATPRSVFSFKVKLWDFQVATVVQKALKRQNITAQTGDIIILPMQFVRVGLGNPNPNMEVDEQWTSFGDEPLIMSFRLFPKDDAFCQKMLNDAKTKTEFFLSTIKLNFEFTMTASSTVSRHVKIKSNFLQKSSFYSNLTNHNADKNGTVYLTSEDANKLAHEVYNSATFDEEVSDQYKASNQEETIIKELLKTFEQDKIQSIELSKENWDSVFWDDIFTRPDIQTGFLNDTMTYNEKDNQFKFDQEKADAYRNKVTSQHSDGHKYAAKIGGMFEMIGLDLGGSYTNTHSDANSNEVEKKSKNNINVEDFNKALEKNKWNVKWTGQKFEQKNLELCRVNTKNLESTSETAFNKVITSKEQSGQTIEIKLETDLIEFDHIYDEITTTTSTTTTTTTTVPTTTVITTTIATTTTAPPKTTTTKKVPQVMCDPNVVVSGDASFTEIGPNYRGVVGRGAGPCHNSVQIGSGSNSGRRPSYQAPAYYPYRQPVQPQYQGNGGWRAPAPVYRNPYGYRGGYNPYYGRK